MDTFPREGSQSIDAVSSSRVDDEVAVKTTKTIRAADHPLAAATHTNATVRELPATPDGVMSLRRRETEMFEPELKSATKWKGDAQLLKTLPQSEAKLATLQTREWAA